MCTFTGAFSLHAKSQSPASNLACNDSDNIPESDGQLWGPAGRCTTSTFRRSQIARCSGSPPPPPPHLALPIQPCVHLRKGSCVRHGQALGLCTPRLFGNLLEFRVMSTLVVQYRTRITLLFRSIPMTPDCQRERVRELVSVTEQTLAHHAGGVRLVTRCPACLWSAARAPPRCWKSCATRSRTSSTSDPTSRPSPHRRPRTATPPSTRLSQTPLLPHAWLSTQLLPPCGLHATWEPCLPARMSTKRKHGPAGQSPRSCGPLVLGVSTLVIATHFPIKDHPRILGADPWHCEKPLYNPCAWWTP